jgi:hypothetical protein
MARAAGILYQRIQSRDRIKRITRDDPVATGQRARARR